MGESREFKLEIALDRDMKNSLIIKFFFNDDFSDILKFAVVFLHEKDGKFNEIVKYDGSEKERLNVHRNYLDKSQKLYLRGEISFDTMEACVKDIKGNWRMYLLKFLE